MCLPPVEKNVTIGQNLKAANANSTLPEVDLISLDLDGHCSLSVTQIL